MNELIRNNFGDKEEKLKPSMMMRDRVVLPLVRRVVTERESTGDHLGTENVVCIALEMCHM